MAQHRITRFTQLNSTHLSDEYRTDEYPSQLLAYVDHHGNGTVTVLVHNPYTGRTRQYKPRPTSKGLGIVTRHLDAMGYKNCVSFQDLTAETDAGKL